ncbi:MAG: LuxR C-terminal-related transcriptional regulator [Oscillospiraceae bacterium]|nr:LuxR C-terminal-related transcriptional regulator [Oscillospiraceae bacterium]
MIRTALMNRLDKLSVAATAHSSTRNPVIYMHAPAGYGKTTAALSWLEHRERGVQAKRVWLGLNDYDNNLSEFCKRFVLTLSCLSPDNKALREFVAHPGFAAASPEFAWGALDAFRNAPDFEEQEHIFVFDDLHIITGGSVLELLMKLIRELSARSSVLVLSRNSPPDCFAEMLLKGETVIVDSKELQLTAAEIRGIFAEETSKSGLGKPGAAKTITAAQSEKILHMTGGWAIGVRALLLSDEKGYEKDGDDGCNVDLSGRYLESFLKTHVWERWDEPLRTFMMLVSVVEELTPQVCEFLSANTRSLKGMSAAAVLEGLYHENAFLRKIGSNSYRFRDLFREFLLSRLCECSEKNGEKSISVQQSKAGDFFYENREYYRSVEYYARAGNDDGVAKSFYCMYNYNSPYAAVEDTLNVVRTFVDENVVKKFPFLLEVQAWAAFVDGRPDELEAALDRYNKLAPKIILQNPRSAVTAVLLRCMDYRVSFLDIIGKLRLIPFKGNFKAATPSISQNLPYFHRGSRDFSELIFEIDKNITFVSKAFDSVLGKDLPVILECFRGGFAYEQGDLSHALEGALAACAEISEGCSPEIKFCAMMILCEIFAASSQPEKARETIADIKLMIEKDKAFYLTANLEAYTCRMRLNDGDTEAAEEWLKTNSVTLNDDICFYKIYRLFTTARSHIVVGDSARASVILKKLLTLSERYRRPLDTIEACTLLAIIAHKKGKSQEALDLTERAVAIAHEYKYTQIFENEGAGLENILHRLHKRSVQANYDGGLDSGFVKTLYICAVEGAKRHKGLFANISDEKLAFTDKQKSVMKLLCEGYSRNKIAEAMELKPNTVKSHVELIYKKLDVSNNIDAIMKIKKLDIFESTS